MSYAAGVPREQALPALFEEFAPQIYALGMRFCGNEEDARDLVQDVFLSAYKAWDSFEGRSKPTTWLYTIASRACQRMHRKRSGEPERVESLDVALPFEQPRMATLPSEADGPLDAALREEARRDVERAIAELPLHYRMPLVMKELAGLSIAEIGEILELPEATVKTRLHRARLRVRGTLEDVLPKKAVPMAIFSREVCIDLLAAKQQALDTGVSFKFPDQVICERCAELFATLDLTQELCRELAAPATLPEELSREILARISKTPA